MDEKLKKELDAISELNRREQEAWAKESDVAMPYKRFTSIRKLKKSIGFRKIGNWDIWDEISARKDYNQRANRNHYKMSEIWREEAYATL